MKRAAFFLLCLAFLPAALAGDVALTFKDRDVTLTRSIAYVAVDSIEIIDYIADDGVLSMSLGRGEHRMQVILDDPATRGNDYAGSFTILQKDVVESDIMLAAAGSVRGFAIDALDNALPSANISLSCTAPSPLDVPEHADAFGAFFIKAAPVGSCRILASHGDLSGHADIEISKGDLEEVTVRLVPPKREIDRSMVFVSLLAGLVVLLAALRIINSVLSKKEKLLWHRGERVKKEQQEARKEKEMTAKPRAQRRPYDILETLPGEERRVVEYLLANKNASSQARLRHELGIARTTLGRLLMRLEGRKIITTAKQGKMVQVNLTDWFLERE